MFALFYAATGLAMAVYYRRLAARGVAAILRLTVVPLIAAAFLVWVAFSEPTEAYDPSAASARDSSA
jgi:hypothetical protein